MGIPALIYLDLEIKDSELVCQIERILPDATTAPLQRLLSVTWAVDDCPHGHESVGDGVAFVSIPGGYVRRGPSPGKPDRELVPEVERADGLSFSWTESCCGDVLMIFLLPPGYALQSVEEADPLPWVSKVVKGRMALIWSLPGGKPRASCSIRRTDETKITALSGKLNVDFRKGSPRTMPAYEMKVVDTLQEPKGQHESDDPIPPNPLNKPDRAVNIPAKDNIPSLDSLKLLLDQAVKAVPAVKYALGVVGVAAAAAIVIGIFARDLHVAVFGPLVMLVLMVILLLFAKLAGTTQIPTLRAALVFIIWASLVLCFGSLLLVTTGVFFGSPVDLRFWLSGSKSAEEIPWKQ